MLNPSSQTAESSSNQTGENMIINSASGNPINSSTTLSKFLKDVMNPTEAQSIGRPKLSTNAEAKNVAVGVEVAAKEAVEELDNINKSKSAEKRLHKGLLDVVTQKAKLNLV
jgi:hypothetical protein